jgi:hypothetical protein
MEAGCSSDISVNFYQTEEHHYPEDGALYPAYVLWELPFSLLLINLGRIPQYPILTTLCP